MVRGIDRRTFLALLGATPLAASGTVTATPNEHETASVSTEDGSQSDVTWGAFQRDATRTGFHPDVSEGPRDGLEKEWSYAPGGEILHPPVHRDGRVYVGTDEEVVALDADDGTEQWTTYGIETGLAASGDAVFANRQILRALDPSDGSTLWSVELGSHEFLYHPGEDLVFSGYGLALDAGDGTELWETDVSPREYYSLMAADDSRIYVPTLEGVHAIDVTNGESRWLTDPDRTLVRPTVHRGLGTVFAGDAHSSEVYAFDASDGTTEWHVDTGVNGESPQSVAVTGNSVFVSYTRYVVALSTRDGSVLWTHETDRVHSAPVVFGGTVLVGATGGDEDAAGLLALDAGTGDELAHFATADTDGGVAFRSPCAVGGTTSNPTLYGGTGELYALSEGTGGGGTPELGLTLRDETARAGGVAEIAVTVSNPGTAATTGIDVVAYVPSDEWTAAGELPEFGTLAAGASDTQTLGLNVPEDAEGEYELNGVATDDADNRAEDEATVTVEELSFELEMEGGSTEPGGSVRVEATVENTGAVAAEDVALDLPEPLGGWDRSVDDTAGATPTVYSGDEASYVVTLEWETFPAGAVETPSYVLDVPEDAEPRTYTVETSVGRGSSDPLAEATASVEVTPGTVSLALAERTVRPVQVVEHTTVDDAGVQHDPVPDPDMVAGRPTSVLFQPGGERLAALPADRDIPVTVTVDDGDPMEFSLTGETWQSMAGTSELELVSQLSLADADVPVFDMPADVDEIRVTVGAGDGDGNGDGDENGNGDGDGGGNGDGDGGGNGDGDGDGNGDGVVPVESASVTLEAGTDFAVHEQSDLVVGFVAIRDPGGGDNYAGLHGDGRVARFEECHRAITDYVRRTFPVDPDDVFSVVHTDHVEGTTESGNEISDLKAAYDALTEFARDVHGVELDVAIAVVPGQERDEDRRIVSSSDTYFEFHDESGVVGMEKTGPDDQAQAAAAVEARYERTDGGMGVDCEVVGATGVHEVTHHFLPAWDPEDHSGDTALWGDNSDRPLYPDPLAQRRDQSAGDPVDNAHARDDLVSVGYDLVGGFGMPGSVPGRPPAYMSYESIYPQWADAHSYQRLVEGDFEPLPPEDDGGILGSVLSGVAHVSDDGLSIERTTERRGRAAPGVDEGDIEVSLESPSGETVATRRFWTLQGDVHDRGSGVQDGDRRVVFSVPFPPEVKDVRATHEETDEPAEFSVVDATLAAGIRRLPDRAFADDPEDRREVILADARAATDALDDADYDGAREAVATVADRLDGWIRSEYDPAVNQPTVDDLRNLVADLEARLDRLETVDPDADRATATRNATTLPEGTPPDERTAAGTDATEPAETTAADGSLPAWVTGAGVAGASLGVWLRDRLTLDADD